MKIIFKNETLFIYFFIKQNEKKKIKTTIICENKLYKYKIKLNYNFYFWNYIKQIKHFNNLNFILKITTHIFSFYIRAIILIFII